MKGEYVVKVVKALRAAGAVAMSAALVITAAGCISKPAKDKNVSNEGNQKTEAVPDDIWAPFKNTVTLTTIGAENAGIQFQKGDNYQNNPWYRAYKDRFNVNLVNKWISNDYNTKLNLAIADKNIPDVFHVDSERMHQLKDGDMIMNLDEAFEKYASPTIKEFAKKYKDIWDTARIHGHLYALPIMSYGIIDQFQSIWVRQDWLKESGLGQPKTMDDFVKIAKTFAQKHGGYGFAEDRGLTCFNRLALSWGAHPGIWVKQKDGKLGYGSIQPEMKEALKAYAQWYKDGIVNPQFATMKYDKVFQDLIEGKCGVIPMEQWLGYQPMPDVIANQGPGAIFLPYEIPTQDGSPIKGSVSFSNYGYIVVNKNCKNPAAVFKLINFFVYILNDANGKEKPEFLSSLLDHAYPNLVESVRMINPMSDYNGYVRTHECVQEYLAHKKVDMSKLQGQTTKYLNCLKWIDHKDKAGVGDWLQQGSPQCAYSFAKKYVDNHQYVQDAMWGDPTPTLRKSGSTLDDILTEGFTKIIKGLAPIDSFDSLVQKWKEAGGDKATQEINATYGKTAK